MTYLGQMVSAIRTGQTTQRSVRPAPAEYAANHATSSIREKDESNLECVVIIVIAERPRARIRNVV